MEIRTLRYFLELANTKTISGTAKVLHITQPTLSRQLAELEREFGKQLFIRGPKQITLTAEGRRLAEYARTIIEISDKALREISTPEQTFHGDVYVGAGETRAIGIMHRAAARMQQDYPHVNYHLYSGITSELLPRFDSGFFDFFLECEVHRRARCNTIVLKDTDVWGIIMRKDNPLSRLDVITPPDLEGEKLIYPPDAFGSIVKKWAGEHFSRYAPIATFSLPLNATFAVVDGVGSMLCYEDLVETNAQSTLTFRRLSPALTSSQGIHWKKDRKLSPAAELYLGYLREQIEIEGADMGRKPRPQISMHLHDGQTA